MRGEESGRAVVDEERAAEGAWEEVGGEEGRVRVEERRNGRA